MVSKKIIASLLMCLQITACTTPVGDRWAELAETLRRTDGETGVRLRRFTATRNTEHHLRSKGRNVKVADVECVDHERRPPEHFGRVDVTVGELLDSCLSKADGAEGGDELTDPSDYEFCVGSAAMKLCEEKAVRDGRRAPSDNNGDITIDTDDESTVWQPGLAPDELPDDCRADRIDGQGMAQAIVGLPETPPSWVLAILALSGGLLGGGGVLCPMTAGGWGCVEPGSTPGPTGDR